MIICYKKIDYIIKIITRWLLLLLLLLLFFGYFDIKIISFFFLAKMLRMPQHSRQNIIVYNFSRKS
ncbi:MAG: hypothetical protein N7Q72_07050, partial [Spiroplasma sp. Tabriz.8]|nr:hypothetical protein [Spiroplasma sp. Tabriz.8]